MAVDERAFSLDLKRLPNRSFAQKEQQPQQHGSSYYAFARLVFATQCLLVLLLVVLVGGLFYTSFSLSVSIGRYVEALKPYIEEARDRSLHIMKNADESAQSLHNLARQAPELVGESSLLSVAGALNRTTEAVARVTELMKRPTIKMSME